MLTVGDRIAQLLKEYGILHVFGVPGGQTLPFYQGILRLGGAVNHVLMHDERSAGYAADAYARVTGRTGVCDATVGPGATNLVSSLAEAYCSSIPILAVISDIPRCWEHRRVRGNASQAIRQLELFYTISKWQVSLSDPSAVDDVMDAAFRIANSGKPGPVVVSVPEDVFRAPLGESNLKARIRNASFPRDRSAPNPSLLWRAREMILKSRKPLLFVGGGALISGAFDEVRQLAEQLNCPVVTSMTGKGILAESHPCSVGVAGTMGNPIANQIVQEADLVIFIGTKTGQIATFGWNLPKSDIPTVHIDIDSEEIGRNFSDSLPLVSDARLGVRALLDEIANDRKGWDWQPEKIIKKREAWRSSVLRTKQETGVLLKPQVIMGVVEDFIEDTDIAVCDASLASGWVAAYYRITKSGRGYLAPRGLAGLGWGAPAAIGASMALGGEKRVLHFAGDGGLAYSIQELEVMARFNLPIITLVFNNDSLGWIKHVQQSRYNGGFISTDFRHIDFDVVARGFGVRGYTVKSAAELTAALEKEKTLNGPAVIDLLTDQWETPVRTMISKPSK